MLCWRSSFGASSLSESEDRDNRKKSESESEPPPNKKSDVESEGSSSDARSFTRTTSPRNGYNRNGEHEHDLTQHSLQTPPSPKKTTNTPTPSPVLKRSSGRYSHNNHADGKTTPHKQHKSNGDVIPFILSTISCNSGSSPPSLTIGSASACCCIDKSHFPWELLPWEVLTMIWEALPLEDVVRLSLVCRSWRNLALYLSDSLWKRFHRRYFGGPKAEAISWKTDFLRQFKKRQALFSPRGWDSSRVPLILQWVAQSGHHNVLSLLVRRVPRLEYCNRASGAYPALLIAASRGHHRVVSFLLRMGTPPILDRGTSPLHEAAEHGHLEVVKLLLHPPPPSPVVVATASEVGGSDVLRPRGLRAKEARRMLYIADKNGNTPLILACKKGSLDVVSYLYPLSMLSGGGETTGGVGVDGRASSSSTSLFFEEQEEEGEDTSTAASAATVMTRISNHYTGSTKKRPLHAAARGGHLDVVKHLVEVRKEGVDSLHGKQATPLHFASKGGHVDVMAYLVEQGADINARNKRGRTPIFVASLYGCNKAVAFLIEKGADVDLATFHGETPLSVALKYERRGIASLLISHGARQ